MDYWRSLDLLRHIYSMDKCFFWKMGEWGNGGSLKLTSVGRSEPGLKRCGVDLGRFDTLRSDDDLDEVDLLGILVRCFQELFSRMGGRGFSFL
jgi:hypothetical protein